MNYGKQLKHGSAGILFLLEIPNRPQNVNIIFRPIMTARLPTLHCSIQGRACYFSLIVAEFSSQIASREILRCLPKRTCCYRLLYGTIEMLRVLLVLYHSTRVAHF